MAPTVLHGSIGGHRLGNRNMLDAPLQRIPLARVAEPANAVDATLLFCCPVAAFVTGDALCIDGGPTAAQSLSSVPDALVVTSADRT